MPSAVEVKESFAVQSPAVVFGIFSGQVKTIASVAQKPPDLPAMYSELAAIYARLPALDDSSGGLPGDPDTF